MEALYYIPCVYNDDVKPCCPTHLLKARAECLEWFHRVHPEAFIIVGPLFSGRTHEVEGDRLTEQR